MRGLFCSFEVADVGDALLALHDALYGGALSFRFARRDRWEISRSERVDAELNLAFAARAGEIWLKRIAEPAAAFFLEDEPPAPTIREPFEPAFEPTTWFELAVLDESGRGVEGIELVFEGEGKRAVVSTDGAGLARWSDATASFASARLSNMSAARAKLRDLWKTLGESTPHDANPDVQIEVLRDTLGSVALESKRKRTLVLTRANYRVRLIGMFFDTNKCFLLPQAMHGIRKVKRLYDRNPLHELLVVGHTDTDGAHAYNEDLSLERADAVAAYFTDDVDAWMEWFAPSVSERKRWGHREIQHMLCALPARGRPYYDGTPSGSLDNRTLAAIRRFQEDSALPSTGTADAATRRAIVTQYMQLDGTTLPVGTRLTTHGCGEYFPDERTADGVAKSENRRVDVFLFDGVIAPPPPGKISKPGSTAYPCWQSGLLETVDFTKPGSDNHLASRFALDVYERFAASIEENEFVAWSSFVFGADIPIDAYRQLRQKLIDKSLAPPPVRLVIGLDSPGSYDNVAKEICIEEHLPRRAETDADAAETLFIVLLHEFGHHIDNVLRTELSRTGGDAANDEGAIFAYACVGANHPEQSTLPFAYHYRAGAEVELKLEYPEFHEAVKAYLSDDSKRQEAKKANAEFFGAGKGVHPGVDFGHQSIEWGLKDVRSTHFNDEALEEIYFGNWLRDYSQFVDINWLQHFENGFVHAAKEARALVTHLLDLAAKSEFDPKSAPSKRKAQFVVDTKRLGVYRPEQHIDNPKGILDGSKVDPDLRGEVGASELEIDPGSGLKKYITESVAFIEQSLSRSIRAWASDKAEARRLLGQALHTLEDFYAHSNFVELALIRLGYTHVYPWVGRSARVTVERNRAPQSWIPLVTGVFGRSDTIVSVGAALGEALEKDIECKAGTFSAGSVELLALLMAVTPDGGRTAESALIELKKLEAKYPKLAKLTCEMWRAPKMWIRAKIGTAIRDEVTRAHVAQSDFFADAASHDPTHSMLSKDHSDHPLHAIAAQCAKAAVTEVGKEMAKAWDGNFSREGKPDPVAIARKYLVHPNDLQLASSDPKNVASEQLMRIDTWAKDNLGTVATLDEVSSIARFFRHAKRERDEALDKARKFTNGDENAKRTSELTRVSN